MKEQNRVKYGILKKMMFLYLKADSSMCITQSENSQQVCFI